MKKLFFLLLFAVAACLGISLLSACNDQAVNIDDI